MQGHDVYTVLGSVATTYSLHRPAQTSSDVAFVLSSVPTPYTPASADVRRDIWFPNTRDDGRSRPSERMHYGFAPPSSLVPADVRSG